MRCVLVILFALLLAATTCLAAEDPLESLNTVEDTLHTLSQQRCHQQNQGDATSLSSHSSYAGSEDREEGESATAQRPVERGEDSCNQGSSDPR